MNYYAKGNLAAGAQVKKQSLAQWIDRGELVANERIADRCTVEFLQQTLSRLPNTTVTDVKVVRGGDYVPPQSQWDMTMVPVPETITGLPEFCEVTVERETPGQHIATILVWVPLEWNKRYLATGGMGSITGPLWFDLPTFRTMTMPWALRNGFATSATNAGNVDPRFHDWAFDAETGKVDHELLRNWSYRGTHYMAEVSKIVIEALTQEKIQYSYYAGCSGGGRQGLASAQHFPDDFDGIWTADPAFEWNKFWARTYWGAVVQNQLGIAVHPAKLEVIKDAALQALDGVGDGLRDGVIGAYDPAHFEVSSLIGEPTPVGKITELEAEAIQMIHDGPKRRSGERIAVGTRFGFTTWSMNGESGMFTTEEVDGVLKPRMNDGGAHYKWVTEDPHLDWREITFERFEELYDLAEEKLGDYRSSDPDLTKLKDSGGKLLITQAADDQVVPFEVTVQYYEQVVDALGGDLEEAKSTVRLFISDGDQHGILTGPLGGVPMAAAMSALMNWVEKGESPEVLIAEKVDVATGDVVATRPVFHYPIATRYSGSGDVNDSKSYVPESMPRL